MGYLKPNPLCVCVCVYIYIYISSCHAASSNFPDLSLPLCHPLLLADLGYILCSHRASVNEFELIVQHLLVHVKGSRGHVIYEFSLTCPACFVHWTWMVLEREGRWLYSSSFVGCCFQDLFNTALRILVQLPPSFFSMY